MPTMRSALLEIAASGWGAPFPLIMTMNKLTKGSREMNRKKIKKKEDDPNERPGKLRRNFFFRESKRQAFLKKSPRLQPR
jgi:hypothetical protein